MSFRSLVLKNLKKR
jgi:hypothetical protein